MRRLLPALLATALAVAAACTPGGPGEPAPSPTGPTIAVGTGPDAESRLLAAVMAELLVAAGIPAEVVDFADSGDARQAIELGAIDVRAAYTGEAWLEVLERADPPADPRTSFTRVQEFDERNGLVWMRPRFVPDGGISTPPANATFAFVVRGPPSIDADVRTMSQLATRLAERPDEELCVDEEFAARSDGLPAVFETYRIRLDYNVLATPPQEAARLVAAGRCIAGLSTATDPQAWLLNLRPLVDDLQVFPAFVVVPQYREEVRREEPGIVPALAPLASNLTTELLGRWNARLAAGEPRALVATEAARELLDLAGRLPAAPVGDPTA
ncbi:MAG: hypothetical protein KY461_06570 [Actinobacteria bacterium]|nr:hypothetical protein [Actinomycetota bacterium]